MISIKNQQSPAIAASCPNRVMLDEQEIFASGLTGFKGSVTSFLNA